MQAGSINNMPGNDDIPEIANEIEVVAARTRKRKHDKENWIRNVRKCKRAGGEEYINSIGNPVKAVELTAACNCKRRCCEKVGGESIKDLFTGFYALKDKDKQDAYLFSLISKSPVLRQRQRTGTGVPRSSSFYYKVKTASGDIPVCKKAFTSIFGITMGRVGRLCEHMSSGSVLPPTDMRGKHNSHYTVPEEEHRRVCQHIRSFPPRQSHYSRHDNHNKQYLSENLNIKRMYSLYLQKHEPEQFERITAGLSFTGTVKESYYR